MKLTMLHCEVLMHYAFGVGDMPGAFTAGTAVRDVFQNLLEQGAVELHPRHQSQDGETRILTGTYYVLSEDGRNLVDQILRDGMSFKQPSDQQQIDADFEKWIVDKHGSFHGRKHPLKEVYATEYKAYLQGRLDEQKQ